MDKKILLIVIISVSVGFGIGLLVSKRTGISNKQTGLNIASLSQISQVPEIKSISGKIKIVNGGSITLEVNQPQGVPSQVSYKEANIKITEKTEIYTIDFSAPPKIDEKTGASTIPKKNLLVADLKVDASITVETDENIKDKNNFEAKSINLISPEPSAQ